MTVLSQAEESSITDKDRKVEALLQLHQNSLLRLQNFELVAHNRGMSEYVRGRDDLILQLHNEIWVNKEIGKEKDLALTTQEDLIVGLQLDNTKLKGKIKRKNRTILILIGVDVAIILGLLIVK